MRVKTAMVRPIRNFAMVALAALCWPSVASAAEQPDPIPSPATGPFRIAPSTSGKQAGAISIGGDVGPNSYAVFAAGSYALNGDIAADGFVVRLSGSVGKYKNGPLAVGNSHVAFQNVSALIGYQHSTEAGRFAFFVGPDYTHNGSGASADVRGGSWNARVVGEATLKLGKDVDLDGWGTYSTFKNQYYLQVRPLYHASSTLRVGPDVGFMGGKNWHQNRIGLHGSIGMPFGELGLGIGHTWGASSDIHEGVYANAIVSFAF
jgi:hypothetical protein